MDCLFTLEEQNQKQRHAYIELLSLFNDQFLEISYISEQRMIDFTRHCRHTNVSEQLTYPLQPLIFRGEHDNKKTQSALVS